MSKELLPCPFCGSDNVRIWSTPQDLHCGLCDSCGGNTPWSLTESNAFAIWNRRPVIARPAAPEALPDYKKRFEAMVDMLGEITQALGISDDEAACANGNDVILSAIRELKSERDNFADDAYALAGAPEALGAAKGELIYAGVTVAECLETLQGIVDADWRKWEELASPEEFVRWAKSRCNAIIAKAKEQS